MTRIPRRVTCGAVAIGLMVVAATTPAVAADAGGPTSVSSSATKTIAGTVANGGGMRLVALHATGRATRLKLPPSGQFRVVGTAGTTLHLIAKDGSYFGPILLRGNKPTYDKSGLVYEAVKGTGLVRLGLIDKRAGFARARKMVAPIHVNTLAKASAMAVAGRPLGAGRFGLVNIPNSRLLLAAPIRPALDNDRDGVPSAFDIDDNGNKRLDNVDRSRRIGALAYVSSARVGAASAQVTAADLSTDGFRMFSNYKSTAPDFSDIINANVAVPTRDQLNESVRAKTTMAVQVLSGASLSCTGQVYCPALPMSLSSGVTGDYQWHVADTYPALKAGDVTAGDTFIETVGGAAYPGVLNFAFLTTPALKSYTILNAQGGEVSTTTVDWGAPNKAGSTAAPIPVDVTNGQKVKLTFWRPQRPVLAGEVGTNGYMDIGGLVYSADAHPGFCAASAGDSSGQTVPDGPSTVVQDLAPDGAPAAGRTLSMIVDLSTCSANDVDIQAKSLFGDNAAQKVFFTRS